MIGRTSETEELQRLYDSNESEFVAIYGRRRVGKTYLVKETFDGRFTFLHTGLANIETRGQILHFFKSLRDFGYTERRCPQNWFEAFDALEALLQKSPMKRKVVFIDELPWMDTSRSDFITALGSFWNEWASARKDVLFIICGSASSWIIKKIFRNRGGLHNRVTARMALRPFTLRECELFARDRELDMTRKDIVECYMALGGIPYYWKALHRGKSLAQNLDMMFFDEVAPLRDEFNDLYSSLFKNASGYKKIVEALATKKIGMSRSEIAELTGIHATGRLSDMLDTLVASGFLRWYRGYGKKKRDGIYQLIDNFTLFHFRFLTPPPTDEHFWSATLASQAQAVWRGLAFERVCLQHLAQIRRALGVGSIHVEAYGWQFRGNETYPDGVQIDMILERADNVINICEVKYSANPFAIDKAYDAELGRKAATFAGVTGTKKALHLTLVTANGLVRNQYSGRVQSQVVLDDLFDA